MKNTLQELRFFEAVEARRSVRIFDQESEFDHDIVRHCLEAAILSPNSSNLQLYQFVRVPESSPLKDPLAQLCMRQKAATTARELVVIITRRDLWKSRAKANYDFILNSQQNQSENKVKQAGNYYKNLIPKLFGKYPGWSLLKKLIAWWVGMRRPMVREVGETEVRISVHKSAALASMTFMLGMKAAGYDTCPMEGFDSKRVKKLLDLPDAAEICMIIGCGKGLPEGIYGPRFRVPSSELIVEK
ncbi:MAG TPA: nitroreductase family protein [Algoriphagus sp.]|jgi:nitroreductase|uniref:nitroreductase family protein n=1 Tax=unclassified Algoriphagus TaxID=2641541 RepID=UPI000C5AE6C8|nr:MULTISPECIES: nitroreductase family protein [unclassified Algoriphagus]MAL14279.1 nitroreductase family protein [Algoriphagus sp.]QYH37395.1 nitroreductase family protein [Algoriphagus sp. NBT04N3]HAD51372.1 nitroreductase family protein [Algoriphagus sp.]HAH36892.1 nitroreductase family protein [Algoriphagus sp.]HAS60187.1 nitroreductase family protein [Algoriphagus sp.]|tara:strand:+ start:145 stop:876 length:732 start_codon:yes stop_codon:yes gene_type:complete